MDAPDETTTREPADTLDTPSVVDDSKSEAMIAVDDTRPIEATIPFTEPGRPPVVHRLYAVPGVQVVPLELVEEILNHMLGWNRDLLNCALTHSSWSPWAIMILYMHILINGRSQFDALRKRLRRRDIGAHHALFSQTEVFAFTFPARRDPCIPDALAALAGLAFPELRTLRFSTVSGESGTHYCSARGPSQEPPWSVPFSFSKSFSSVTILSLTCQGFRGLRELVRTVCAFPQLQNLELEGACDLWGEDAAHLCVTPTTGGRLRLQRLLLNCGERTPQRFISWFIKTRAAQERTLRNLVCINRNTDEHDLGFPRLPHCMAQLLNQLSSSLTTLEISVTAADPPVDLSQNISLETLHLFLTSRRHGAHKILPELQQHMCRKTLLPTFASLHRDTRLRRLFFTIQVVGQRSDTEIPSDVFEREMDWRSLNILDTYEQYEHLQEVVVIVNYSKSRLTTALECQQVKTQLYNEIKRGLQELVWYSRGLVQSEQGILEHPWLEHPSARQGSSTQIVCTLCGRSYSRMDALQCHMKKAHVLPTGRRAHGQ